MGKIRGRPFEKGYIPWNKGKKGYYRKPDSVVHKPFYKELIQTWRNMRNRCTKPNVNSYERYGGAGITVCERWRKFNNFYHDMIPTYKKGLTIDRINSKGNYEKENCRWSTMKEQCLNRKSNRIIDYKNVKKTLQEWSDITGIKRSTIEMRLDKYGWGIEASLETPVRRYFGLQ